MRGAQRLDSRYALGRADDAACLYEVAAPCGYTIAVERACPLHLSVSECK